LTHYYYYYVRLLIGLEKFKYFKTRRKSAMISIEGLDKAAVLAALYNASHPQGLGFVHADSNTMTIEEAQRLLDRAGLHKYFDYLKGRVMKIGLASNTSFEEVLYDRDNGQGVAARVIDSIRALAEKRG